MGNDNTDKVKQLFGPKTGKNADLREKSLAQWAEEFLEHYLRDGLGVMSKKETEVLVMSLLEQHAKLDGKTNHELSLLFQQPETRVANLRYEAKLRYPPDEKEYVQRRLIYVLAQADFEAEDKRIRLIIEDKFVRQYLHAEFKRKGKVVDTSFNREIVDVQWEQLPVVVGEIYGASYGTELEKQLKQVVDKQHKLTFAEAKKGFFKGLAEGTGKAIPATVKAAADLFTGGATT